MEEIRTFRANLKSGKREAYRSLDAQVAELGDMEPDRRILDVEGEDEITRTVSFTPVREYGTHPSLYKK